ncbi:phosphotransferase family protein [Brevibacterium sp. HMSC063G07]|uniref:phosphotransferase family protein n=1 Tax=Brevibacterium sp. HMSC063G07 TaxID=1739261 RepID=UPI0008A64477|nr:phosphotransferase family protein [Brevibacterium sp. HMSC063G07]OFL64138.1 aminoglycoside phosphotransferase [Brevibacterium sp. HMSC063G07]
MLTQPDGIEVVATRTEAQELSSPPLLVLESLTEYLDEQRLGSGPVAWQRIGEGQSNITYLLRRGDTQFVLRRGPRPPLPKSTHDMKREARIQSALAPEGIAVPSILALCEDEAVLGVPFYIMEFLDGEVVTDRVPDCFAGPEGPRIAVEAMVDSLAALHSVDVSCEPVSALGRPEGYLERQVQRFSGLWGQTSKREVPQVDAIAHRLASALPTTQRHSVVHGDFRMGNVMYEKSAPPRIQAILDWEMATLGDPLADLGYLVATYADPSAEPTIMELTPVTRGSAFPTRDEVISRYADRTGLDVSPLKWYMSLALWKAAIFSEAIYTRWLNGERPDDPFAANLDTGVLTLLDQAQQLIEE